MASIADVFFKALLDDKQLQIDAVKSGDKAGQSMGERMSKGVGLAMKAGLGLIAGGAALALRGMAELDDITAQFTADTGVSADEAARARKAINEMAGRNLQPMREIGAVLTKVHTDMGLTGDAAEQTAERFLKFATVTKRDASEEVAAFDDILDAWNLTADKSQGIMDALIVSHQKYGGSIAADEAALRGLAPTLRAANQTWEDGLGLINLFKTAGLDAEVAVTGITKALGKVKSPAELQRLVDDIIATEDPFLRAQKAADLFGAKAGAKLANVLRPGIGSLAAFKETTDEVTGATDKAADAIENTFGNRAQLLLKGFTSKLIELGDQFGPVVTAIAGLASLGGALGLDKVLGKVVKAFAGAGKEAGEAFVDAAGVAVGTLGTIFGNIIAKVIDPTERLLGDPLRTAATKAGVLWSATFAAGTRLANAIGDLLLSIPGVQRVVTAATASGSALGTLFAGAVVAAIPLVLVGGIVNAFNEGKDRYKATAEQAGTDIATAMAAGNIDELKRQRANIAAAITQAFGDADVGGFDPFRAFRTLGSSTDVDKLRSELDKIDAFIANYSTEHPAVVTVQPKLGPPIPIDEALLRRQFLAAGELLATAFLKPWNNLPIGEKIVGMGHDVRLAAANVALQAAAGLRSGRNNIDSALDQLREDMKNRLSPRKEVALRIGQLFSHTLVRGLKDGDPLVRKQAEGTRALIEDELVQTVLAGGQAGKHIQEELARNLKSKDPDVKRQAQRTKALLDAALKAKSAPKSPGDAIGAALQADLGSTGTALGRTAYNLGRTIYQNLFAGVHGTGIVPPSGTGTTGSGGRRRQHGGPVVAGQAYMVGEVAPEWFVPDVNGRISTTPPVAQSVVTETAINVGPINVDARGATNPRAVGQAVMDAVANGLRGQTARLPVGVRS